MNHVLTSHTMQMIYDPQCIKVLKLKIKEGQRRDLLFQKKHSWIYVLRLGKIIDFLFPTVAFEKVNLENDVGMFFDLCKFSSMQKIACIK